MKAVRIRVDLKGKPEAACPCCGAPCWLLPELGVVHRVPVCRWFDTYERPNGRRVQTDKGVRPEPARGPGRLDEKELTREA